MSREKILLINHRAFKQKYYNAFIDMLPFWLCRDYQKNGKRILESFKIVAISKECFIYDNYDCDEINYLKFKDIDRTYIMVNEATDKQKIWLEDNGYDSNISGYHAWNIIHNEVERQKESRKEREEGYDMDDRYLDTFMDYPNC